ncbi:MAG: UvrD-helicase domain-containing protein, partial [Eubacteriales bacterium]|nr:UvrD-helicase domain-containing protein [Eubacteriales bacterium]
MNREDLIEGLNDRQKEAVLTTEGPVLVLAGAGSGKTRILTHRIGYLILKGVRPWNILAITFTNKAAKEMKDRTDSLLGAGQADMVFVSTFHSMCVRLLRRDIEKLGYGSDFVIYDADDQRTLIRGCIRELNLDTKMYRDRAVQSIISSRKNLMMSAEDYSDIVSDFYERNVSKIYSLYEKRLKENNALDFDDLLIKTVELFKNCPEVLAFWQDRFRYIMVDEYQDTNSVQFEIVRMLAEGSGNLCVVGDDDQSIYRFRGADIRNILDFEKSFPGAAVIKLEQNYRSTRSILNAANAVIKNNRGRKEKSLWTENEEGTLPVYNEYETAAEEADEIVKRACAAAKQGI